MADWTDTTIGVTVPSGANDGNVVVTVGGQLSNGLPFTVLPDTAPQITTIYPPFGHIGTPLTINGLNFGSSQGTSTVTLNGVTAQPISWSDSSITLSVPAGATPGDILVSVNGVDSNGMGFVPDTQPDGDTVIAPTYQTTYPWYVSDSASDILAVGTDGFSRFVMNDSSPNGDYDELVFVRCLDTDCNAYHSTVFNTGSWTYHFAVGLGPDDLPQIAYIDEWNDPPEGNDYTLRIIRCNDLDCTSYSNSIVDGTGISSVLSMAVRNDGTAFILYNYGHCCDWEAEQGVGLATCSQSGCGQGRIAATSIWGGMGGTVRVGPDGNPAIAYFDTGVNWPGIYVVPESTHYYFNGSDTLLFDHADVPNFTFGSDGLPRVVTWPSSNNVQWFGEYFVNCASPTCGENTVRPLQLPSFTMPSEIVVPDDGLAILAAVERANVHYITCASNDCSTFDDNPIQGDWLDNYNYLQSLAMRQGADGLPRIIALNPQKKLTHVRKTISVKIRLRFGDTDSVSSDDAGGPGYLYRTGTSKLGHIVIPAGSNKGCGIGYEVVGKVTPSNYQAKIILNQRQLRKTLFAGQKKIADVRNHDDPPDPPLTDFLPQSGQSGGQVYYTDAPGPYSLSILPYRYRSNFYSWASLDDASPQKPWGTRISAFFPFYVRASCITGAQGFEFKYDIPGDNQLGFETTYNSWDLSATEVK